MIMFITDQIALHCLIGLIVKRLACIVTQKDIINQISEKNIQNDYKFIKAKLS